MKADASQRLYERALKSVPAGTHSNSRAATPHPRYYARADGAYLWDIDGNRWTDYVMGNAAVILGHNNPHVNDAVLTAMNEGLGAGVESELSITAAETFLGLVPTADQVRFTNTGTEAALHALHLARAITGRQGIAKIEGAYHGWWDEVFVSTWPDLSKAGHPNTPTPLPGGPGLKDTAVRETIVLPFNNLDATRQTLTQHHNHIAALFVEPTMIDVGFIPPEPNYLQGLRDITQELGILLVFDELLTGFRVSPGGAQQKYGVTPDLSMWGKALANGFPLAALAGRREHLERTTPGPNNAPFVGTYNGYRPALAACVATLQQLQDGSVIQRLNERSDELSRQFKQAADQHGVPATLHAGGGHFQPYFTNEPVTDYRSAARTNATHYDHWRNTLATQGITVAPKALLHSAFSAAHTDDDLAALLEATRHAFQQLEKTHA